MDWKWQWEEKSWSIPDRNSHSSVPNRWEMLPNWSIVAFTSDTNASRHMGKSVENWASESGIIFVIDHFLRLGFPSQLLTVKNSCRSVFYPMASLAQWLKGWIRGSSTVLCYHRCFHWLEYFWVLAMSEMNLQDMASVTGS